MELWGRCQYVLTLFCVLCCCIFLFIWLLSLTGSIIMFCFHLVIRFTDLSLIFIVLFTRLILLPALLHGLAISLLHLSVKINELVFIYLAYITHPGWVKTNCVVRFGKLTHLSAKKQCLNLISLYRTGLGLITWEINCIKWVSRVKMIWIMCCKISPEVLRGIYGGLAVRVILSSPCICRKKISC